MATNCTSQVAEIVITVSAMEIQKISSNALTNPPALATASAISMVGGALNHKTVCGICLN